ncbi:Lsr2 family protein [Dermatophilaceae bacterium Soc4.6]
MAQRVQVVLEDDVDGGDASETVLFGLDGVSYEIDLNDTNASALREALATWVGHARRSGGRRTTGRKAAAPGSSPKRNDLSEVREWARKNGHTVSERGRVSAAVQEAYDQAHG